MSIITSGIARRVTAKNHLPGFDDDRFPVYSKQFNDLVDVILSLNPAVGTLAADIITECTLDTGVTIDDLLIKDGNIVLDTDENTWIGSSADDEIDFQIGGANDFLMLANIFRALSGSSIETDTINETTADNGVVIDGVVCKDSAVEIAGNQIIGAQQAAEADPGSITDYIAHAPGATPVTSSAATDLDTTAAALATLEDEVTALRASYVSLLGKLRAHGIIAT